MDDIYGKPPISIYIIYIYIYTRRALNEEG